MNVENTSEYRTAIDLGSSNREMTSEGIAISARGLCKSYAHSREGLPIFQRSTRDPDKRRRLAVHDVSFDIRRGETVGIVGRNGAGKSTLLKLIAGITAPDSGHVESSGAMTQVIGPAAGMKPDLSGRENILIRAMAMGVSANQAKEKLESIIDFAELGEHIDRPLRTYSTGMRARLGFAISFAFQPEILLIDETLAGGDAGFRRKVLARVAEIQQNGATIVLVSHAPNMIIQFCTRAILIERGELIADGAPKETVQAYQKLLLAGQRDYQQVLDTIRAEAQSRRADSVDAEQAQAKKPNKGIQNPDGDDSERQLIGFHKPSSRWESLRLGANIVSISISLDSSVEAPSAFDHGVYRCDVLVKLDQPVRKLHGEILIKTAEGIEAATIRLEPTKPNAADHPYLDRQTLSGRFLNLLQTGTYSLDASITGTTGDSNIRLHSIVDAIEFECVGPEDDSKGIVDLNVPMSRTATVRVPKQETERK